MTVQFPQNPHLQARFHTACLSGWERGTCPICRAPDVEAASPAAPEARYLIREDSEAPRSDTVSRSSDAEFQFRLRRTRALYPDVVTDSMVNRWASDGPGSSPVADVDFVRAEAVECGLPSTLCQSYFDTSGILSELSRSKFLKLRSRIRSRIEHLRSARRRS